MEALNAIIISLFFVFLVHRSVKKSKFSQVIKHGHRCFSDGLNISEQEVVNTLSQGLSHKDYFIFNNLIIPSLNAESTQIDHIIVSKFGIFVIETKECNGWIYAHQNRAEWPVTYRRSSKHHIRNPIWQNHGHRLALMQNMPFIEENFIEIVVFTGQCTFKTPDISNVVHLNKLISLIEQYATPKINEQRLLMAIGKLSYMCQAVDITPEQHIANVKHLIAQKQNNETKLVGV